MKRKIKTVLNNHYNKYLAKEKYRNRLNSCLFRLWKILYRLFCLLPVEKKSVLFAVSNDFTVPEDFKTLVNYAEKSGYNIRFIFKSRNTSNVIYINELKKILNDIKFQYYYAISKATFVSDFFLPCFANKPRKGTKLIQIWHGCGAFKKFSYSTKDTDWGLKSDYFEKYNVHKTYSLVTTSSESVNEIYAEAFANDISKVRALGVPRTDVFFDQDFVKKQKDILIEKFPELNNKKIILWAPTFRGNSLKTSSNDVTPDFKKLKELIGNNYAILVKLHPLVAKGFSSESLDENLKDFVYDISKTITISSALCFSDIVISDYSSLIFEYSLMEKPMIFFAYDLDEYNNGRSFYYNYEDFVPGKIVKTTEEIASAIKEADTSFDKEKVISFKNKFMSACDGKSTQRIFEYAVK